MGLLSIGKFAKLVGVTSTTLRRMQESGELIPAHITQGGTRYYSTEQLKQFYTDASKEKKLVVGYCRVSTPSQKDDLQTQIDNVKSYMYAKGYEFDIITDIGSGINYKKQGLKELIDDVNYNLILEPKVPRATAHLVAEKTRELCMWVATIQNLKGKITKEELAEELYKLFDIPEIDLNHKPYLGEEAERFYNLSLKIKNHNLKEY